MNSNLTEKTELDGGKSSSGCDSQEFVKLLTDHQEMIRLYILSLIPNCPDVRDLTQDVNVLLWEKKGEFELGTNFGAWACTVAYYKVFDYRKKQKRQGFLVLSNELCEAMAEDIPTRTPELLERKKQALTKCLSLLSENNRKLLCERYLSSRGNMAQIALDFDRSRASLRVTFCRLRSSLRKCINDYLEEERGRV